MRCHKLHLLMNQGFQIKEPAHLASPISRRGYSVRGRRLGLPWNPVRLPGEGKKLPGHPIRQPWTPVFQPDDDNSLPGDAVHLPGNPVFLPGNEKIQPGRHKNQPWNDKFLPWMLVSNHLRRICQSDRRNWSKNDTFRSNRQIHELATKERKERREIPSLCVPCVLLRPVLECLSPVRVFRMFRGSICILPFKTINYQPSTIN